MKTSIQQGRREVLDAVYRMDGSWPDWMERVHSTLGSLVDLGQGTLLTLVDLSSDRPRLSAVRNRGAHPLHSLVLRLSFRLVGGKLREAFFNGRYLDSSSGYYVEGDFDTLEKSARPMGARDAAGFCVNDGVNRGLMVVAPSAQTICWSPSYLSTVRGLGPHVSAGLRLRRAVETCSLDGPAAEAVFETDGRCQKVTGMAREPEAIASLREAVLRGTADNATHMTDGTEALLSGRWSLVDRFDSDRRRYLVAYRNPAGVIDPRQLSAREREVAALAALGMLNKEIASDLGLTMATTAMVIATILTKLGLKSRSELPLFWRDLHGDAWRLGDEAGRLLVLVGGLVATEEAHGHSSRLLTPSEVCIAIHLTNGDTYEQIAAARGVSKRTVANQAASTYRKLGVGSRTELAAYLARGGGARSTAGDAARYP
jgi:DNA-binding NarL/FixJ family response regulator